MIRQYGTNGWFCREDFLLAAMVVNQIADTQPTRWLNHGGLDCKYVQLRVDMRTGDFCIQNNDGHRMTNEEVLDMFPQLGPIVTYGEEVPS